MRKYILFLIITSSWFMAHSQSKINITIGAKTMSALLSENVATKALIEKLGSGPVTITMSDYGGFEKVGALPWSLPTADTRITTRPGDIMLYTGDNMVIFYGQNTWSYTPLGTLETSDPELIRNFLGSGSKDVTLSLENNAQVQETTADNTEYQKVYSLDGHLITCRPLPKGIYVVNNTKVVVK